MNDIIVYFLAIFLEALPFLLIGSLFSVIVEKIVDVKFFKLIKNNIFSYFLAAVMGLVLPVCECMIIPVIKSFLKKGLNVGIALTFMLSSPIINPIVILSTYYAFNQDINVVLLRIIFAFIISIIIGIIFSKEENYLNDKYYDDICCDINLNNNHECESCDKFSIKKSSKFEQIVLSASKEFLNISFYMIIGALIASLFHMLPKEILLLFRKNSIISILFMQTLSFFMSLCSQADAFIAKSFLNIFDMSSIYAFMVFGAMLDIKNIMIMSTVFNKKFIIKLSVNIFILNFIIFLFYDTILKIG